MSSFDVPASAPHPDPFTLWNIKLLETFFSSACQGDEVWLQVDSEELDLIGPELGGDEGFLMAVRAGPAWPTFSRNGKFTQGYSADLVSRVNGLVRQRLYPAYKPRQGYVDPGLVNPTYHGCKAPTYLPFLAALVRSSALASKDGYYKHLREALHLPDGTPTNEALRSCTRSSCSLCCERSTATARSASMRASRWASRSIRVWRSSSSIDPTDSSRSSTLANAVRACSAAADWARTSSRAAASSLASCNEQIHKALDDRLNFLLDKPD